MNNIGTELTILVSKAVDREIKRVLPDMVKEAVTKDELSAALDPHIEDIFRRIFKKKPDAPLNELGFGWAWIIAIKTFWPEMKRGDAMRELRDHMPDAYGHPDYDWSFSMALEMAREYVSEFGEATA